jgi:long-chain acyl-CoA synthetase
MDGLDRRAAPERPGNGHRPPTIAAVAGKVPANANGATPRRNLVATVLGAILRKPKRLPTVDEKDDGTRTHRWERNYPPGIDWRAEIPVKPLYALLDETVQAFPTARAMDFLGKKYSYREIDQLVSRVARGLQDLGVVKGTRVGLMLPNTPYYVVAYYGALKAGATVVNYNPLYAERELINQMENSGTEIMFTLDLAMLYQKVAVALPLTGVRKVVLCRMSEILPFPKSPLYRIAKRKERAAPPSDRRHVTFAKLIANDGRYKPVDIDPKTDIAVLQYTGGTTGVPKGAMLTHANLYGNAMQVSLWFPGIVRGGERLLGVLPFFHVFGMTAVMNTAIMTGSELIALPRFEIKSVLDAIDRKKPTLVAGVPTMFHAINTYKQLAKYDLSSIKFCISGGAPLPRPTQKTFEDKTGCRLVEGYGLTECAPVAACNPFVGEGKPGSVGLPLPGTFIEIVDRENPDRLLPIGEKGEVCIRGPQVMVGYWNRPDDNKRVLSGGRLHTGDVGYMDEDGYTYLVDRIKDLILVGGYNVYPRNVEEAIAMHPAVEEVCVIGVHDDYSGELVKAFVKRREGAALEAADLLAFVGDKLAPFERPKRIEFRDALPKTLIGKPSREALIAEERTRVKPAGVRG